jgi:hypothetical protein
MPRWIGSAFLWLGAPLVGVAAINLPFFVYFAVTSGFGPVARQHLAFGLAAAILVAGWGGAVWWLAQRYSGRARQLHVVVSCLLAMAGGLLAFVYGHSAPRAAPVEQLR